MFSPPRMTVLEPLIRERAAKILDELPRGETFDFVDKVAVELTSQMLATLFDYPVRGAAHAAALFRPDPGARRSRAASWRARSSARSSSSRSSPPSSALWNERLATPPRNDLISMLAPRRGDADATAGGYLGNIILLIVAGSDTTRHSITGGLLALNQNPTQYDKLRANPALIESMVPEIIRWQSPVAHMRRTALEDIELGGKTDQEGREGHHVVRLGQPRRRRDRPPRRLRHRPRTAAPARLASASASTAASACAWPRCSCASCGRRS